MDQLIALGARVGDRLKERGETIAVAESSSGGLISAALLAQPGASAFFVSGAVVYTPKARHQLLGLTREDVQGLRSASEPYARRLAETVRTRHGASWGVAETGAAGPTGNPYGDPAGHSCLAVSGALDLVETLSTGEADRVRNMSAFADGALRLLLKALAP